MSPIPVVLSLAGAALLVASVPVSAQAVAQTGPQATTPPTANQGLFRGAGEASEGLSLVLSARTGYDTNVLVAQPGGQHAGTNPLQPGVGNEYREGSGTLAYLMARRETLLDVAVSSTGRFYPGLNAPITHSHSLATALTFGVGQRLDIGLRQGFNYSSFYQLVPVPGGPADASSALPAAASPDMRASGQQMLGYDSGIDVTHTLGARDSIRYHANRREREHDTGLLDRRLLLQGAGATYRRAVGRYGGLRAGYSYQEAKHNMVPAAITHMHNIDTGFDYSRPLSFSRKTTVGLTSGMQILEREEALFYRAGLTASLAHQFGRTWALDVSYDRGVQFVDILDGPVYADTIVSHASGFVGGRRLQILLDASYSNGQLSTVATHNRTTTYMGATRLEWGLTERLSVYGSYAYYGYEFGESIALPPGLLAVSGRHSLQGGLRVWLPLTT